MGDFIHDVRKALKIGNSYRKPVLHIVTFIYLVINIYWPQGKEEMEIQTSDLHFMRRGLQSIVYIKKKCNVNQIRFLNFSWFLRLANEL